MPWYSLLWPLFISYKGHRIVHEEFHNTGGVVHVAQCYCYYGFQCSEDGFIIEAVGFCIVIIINIINMIIQREIQFVLPGH